MSQSGFASAHMLVVGVVFIVVLVVRVVFIVVLVVGVVTIVVEVFILTGVGNGRYAP